VLYALRFGDPVVQAHLKKDGALNEAVLLTAEKVGIKQESARGRKAKKPVPERKPRWRKPQQ
jgi:hypothetical protein